MQTLNLYLSTYKNSPLELALMKKESRRFKKKELRTLENLAQNKTLQCNDFKRRCYGLIINCFY